MVSQASSIRDLWALSKASHLVAAFSSNFARLAYVLAHTLAACRVGSGSETSAEMSALEYWN
eukprot:1195642-Rhodomonas_salina.1